MRWLRFRARVVIEPAVPIVDTDARPHDSPRAKSAADPAAEPASRTSRRLRLVIWNAIFIGGTVAALFGQGGYLDLRRQRAERILVLERLAAQRRAVEAQHEAIVRLRTDPLTKERIARDQLGLAPPGEIQFLLPRSEEADPKAPAPRPE